MCHSYLWRYFDPKTATFAHVMSLVLLINEKFRENMLSIWEPFRESDRIANFRPLFMCILSLPTRGELSIAEKTSVLFFWIHCTQSLEDDIVRDVIYRYILHSLPSMCIYASVSLAIW
jgi:intron-binding protein aquarius